jgi:hypothetical protein
MAAPGARGGVLKIVVNKLYYNALTAHCFFNGIHCLFLEDTQNKENIKQGLNGETFNFNHHFLDRFARL